MTTAYSWPRLLQRFFFLFALLPLLVIHPLSRATPLLSSPSPIRQSQIPRHYKDDYDYSQNYYYNPDQKIPRHYKDDYDYSQNYYYNPDYAMEPPTRRRRRRRRYPRNTSSRILRSHPNSYTHSAAPPGYQTSVPAPEKENEPFYLHTMSNRVVDNYNLPHRHSRPRHSFGTTAKPTYHVPQLGSAMEADTEAEDVDAGDDNVDDTDAAKGETNGQDRLLEMNSTTQRLQNTEPRPDDWTPKEQDSMISGWLQKIAAFFGGSGNTGNATAPSSGATNTSKETEYEQGEDIDEHDHEHQQQPDSLAHLAGEDSSTSLSTLKDKPTGSIGIDSRNMAGMGSPRRNVHRQSRDRHLYAKRQQRRAHSRHMRDDGITSPSPDHWLHSNDRERGAYMSSYESHQPDADSIVEDKMADILEENDAPRLRDRRRRYKRRRGGGMGSSYGDEGNPRVPPSSTRRRVSDDGGVGLSSSLSRDTLSRDEQREGDGEDDNAYDEDPGSGNMDEMPTPPRTEAGNGVGPLSYGETREMVQLFRRLFETLDRVLANVDGAGGTGRRSRRTMQEALPDVRVALEEAESLNRLRDVDRHAGLLGESTYDRPIGFEDETEREDGVRDDNSSERSGSPFGNSASSTRGKTGYDGDSNTKKAIAAESEDAADSDAEEDVKGVPRSSPAYGARKKLLSAKPHSIFGDLYDSIASGLSGMV